MLDRRNVIKGLGAIPLATVLADPKLTRAAADGLQKLEAVTPGGKTVNAFMALPETQPAPAVLLVHEWWGVNDQIKAVTADFAAQGFVALAIDLMDGSVADTPLEAQEQMQAVSRNRDDALQTCALWVDFLKTFDGSTGRVGTCGWCFGGHWSLEASLVAPVDATVIYYGQLGKNTDDLAPLKGPVLGHFATQDAYIQKASVDSFIASMAEAGKSLTVYWYDADHAFANPTGRRYDEEDAALAWERTTGFLGQNLGL